MYPQYQVTYVNYPPSPNFGPSNPPLSSLGPGVVGEALVIDPLQQYVTIMPPTCSRCLGNPANCAAGLTVCTWYMPLSLSAAEKQYIFSGISVPDGQPVTTQTLGMLQTSSLGLEAYVTNGPTSVTTNSGINVLRPNRWHHICVAYKESFGISLYVNGYCVGCNSRGSSAIQTILSSYSPPESLLLTALRHCNFNIGRPSFLKDNNPTSGGTNLRFAIDHFQTWDSALDPDAIYQMYALGKPAFTWNVNSLPSHSAGSVSGKASLYNGYIRSGLKCST